MAPEEYTALVQFLGERFDVIDRRFEAVDRRFEAIDRRFEAIDRRFETIDRRFDAIDRRFEATDQKIADLRADMLGHFDTLYHRLGRVEQEYVAVTQALRRIEGSRS